MGHVWARLWPCLPMITVESSFQPTNLKSAKMLSLIPVHQINDDDDDDDDTSLRTLDYELLAPIRNPSCTRPIVSRVARPISVC